MGRIIEQDRSVIVACDVNTLEQLEELVRQTYDVKGIGGYKLGSILSVRYGLPSLVQKVREVTGLPIIYDHQKAMTDIPALGKEFVNIVQEAGVKALIGFPQAGPKTLEAWVEACRDVDLEIIVGGEMTHAKYRRSEGGYIADEALDEIYLLAARIGVNNFVVPGTKKQRVIHYGKILRHVPELTFYAPGFVAQGGVISDVAKVAGRRWHAIVGRGIYAASNIHSAAEQMTNQLSV